MKVAYGSDIADLSVLRAGEATPWVGLILKPQTFMNIIGKNVAKAMKSERIEKDKLIVIHDDLE
jgi:peptidyl-tRNA hydrolase